MFWLNVLTQDRDNPDDMNLFADSPLVVTLVEHKLKKKAETGVSYEDGEEAWCA